MFYSLFSHNFIRSVIYSRKISAVKTHRYASSTSQNPHIVRKAIISFTSGKYRNENEYQNRFSNMKRETTDTYKEALTNNY